MLSFLYLMMTMFQKNRLSLVLTLCPWHVEELVYGLFNCDEFDKETFECK